MLSLNHPMNIRAEMARRGLAANQLMPWDDPERGWVNPFADQETQTAVRRFMAELWKACLDDEGSE